MQRLGQLLSRMWPFPYLDPNNPAPSPDQPGSLQTVFYPQYGTPIPPQLLAPVPYQPLYHDAGISGVPNATEFIRANYHYGEGTGVNAALFYNQYYSGQSARQLGIRSFSSATDSSTPDTKREMPDPHSGSNKRTRNDSYEAQDKKKASGWRTDDSTSAAQHPSVESDKSRGSIDEEAPWLDHHADTARRSNRLSRKPSPAAERKFRSPTDLRNRPWHTTSFGKEFSQKGPKRGYLEFTVASYNVLAQNLMEEHYNLYNSCSEEFLTWDYRSQNLLNEIAEAGPDIICMQEVNETHFYQFFKPKFDELGYTSLYKKRTGNMKDGCATCFKRDKFELETSSKVEYLHKGTHVLDRDNVGLILLLNTVKKKSRGQKICVVNTHLLFNPRRGDVKLAQVVKLFSEVDKLANRYSTKPWKPNYYPVILCGDFNSEPHSDLHKFLCRGSLSYDGLLCKDISGQTEDRPSNRHVRLQRNFIPKHVGLTDQCQYVEEFNNRAEEYYSYLEEKRRELLEKLKEDESSNDASGAVSRETAENLDLSDAEEAEERPPSIPEDAIGSPASDGASQTSQPSTSADTGDKSNQATYTQGSGTLSHKLNLLSVYKHEYRKGGETDREVTTYHAKAFCTVDYIMYSVQNKHVSTRNGKVHVGRYREGRLRLLGTKELVTDRHMTSYPPLPNEAISSDHFMLMAKFLLKLK